MKKKNGFISMALVYSFLVIFLFIMSSIINVYLKKNAFLEALDFQVSEDIGITKESRATLISKISDDNISHPSNRIDYTSTSINKENGLYYINHSDEANKAQADENDDSSTSRIYFFRGNVDNNVVYGMNSSGNDLCWKIIRTNENGTIRLIYNGILNATYGCNGVNPYVNTANSKFNDSSNDNAYVGFTYGNVASSTSEDTHHNYAEINKSNARKQLESFIAELNLERTHIEDAIYCNDRNIINGEGFAKELTIYKNRMIAQEGKATYKCESSSDRFVLQGENQGSRFNAMFDKNPVGLPTVADIIYAGGSFGRTNDQYYLNTGEKYWTMSPAFYDDSQGGANMYIVSTNGAIDTAPVNSTDIKIRPVISISGNVKVNNGYGTIEEPYILE